MLMLISVIIFVLAAFGVDFDEVNMVALGLAFFAAGHLFDGRLPALGARG